MITFNRYFHFYLRTISAILFAVLVWNNAFAAGQDHAILTASNDTLPKEAASGHQAEEEFNAGAMILEHVVDNHEWHIATLGHLHVTVPLPVILWYNGEIYQFCSSRFHNETHSYKGFTLASSGPDKGKIIRANPTENGENMAKVYDFSITKNVLAIILSSIVMLIVFIGIAKAYRQNPGKAPKGIQSLLEPLILFIRDDIAKSSIGEKKYEKFMPFLLTVFFFIFFNNLLGLIPFFPGGANVTGNISVTLVLAVFTFVITTINGNKHYWIDIVNTPGVPWWLKLPVPLMPVVEIIGIITKPFVLMVRLFANITAGHIIVLGFVSLIFIFGQISVWLGYGVSVVSVAFMLFMWVLELLVAFIQAYVFTLLSALYFGLATVEVEHH
jgi:F-type H+-transporting ATPase subunit a